jgi:hypothetical protein
VDILPVEFAVFWVKVEVPDFNGFIVGTWWIGFVGWDTFQQW